MIPQCSKVDNRLITQQEFSGKLGDWISIRTFGGKMRTVALVGVGEEGKSHEVKLGQTLADIAKKEKCERMAIALPPASDFKLVTQV